MLVIYQAVQWTLYILYSSHSSTKKGGFIILLFFSFQETEMQRDWLIFLRSQTSVFKKSLIRVFKLWHLTPKPLSKIQLSGFTFLHWKTSTHRSGLSRLFIPCAEFWVDRKHFKWTLDAGVHVKTTCWQLFLLCYLNKVFTLDFPGGPVDKNPPVNAGYTDSIPGQGISHMPQSTQGAVHHNYWRLWV